MNLLLNRTLFPVTTLGFGRRVGIWVQGCSIRCPGCVSRDTWEPDGGRAVKPLALMEQIRSLLAEADGVTISGGEPFDQSAALTEFLACLRGEFNGDILIFSGYPWEKIKGERSICDCLTDIVVAGPFRAASGQTKTLRGSDNQTIHPLTELAFERYPADIDERKWEGPRKLDVFEDGEDWIFAGIPNLTWGPTLRAGLSKKGYHSQTSDQKQRGGQSHVGM